MNREEFIYLAEKVAEGKANKEELTLYNRYYNQYQQAYPQWDNIDHSDKEEISQVLQQRIFEQIQPSTPFYSSRNWIKYVAAAVILIMTSLGSYFYTNNAAEEKDITVVKNTDFQPGGNKAYLTLSDGKRIDLATAKASNLTNQSGLNIIKTADGELVYEINNNSTANGSNLIETPTGGQYRVRLPDGTNVWLNASTTMRYPVRFTGAKRLVEIDGEAYFEVAHNAKIPFIVKSKNQEIEVLGTHFNVNAYSEDELTQTTLLEGAVKIATVNNSLLLKPGQQSQVSKSFAKLNLNADIDGAAAWRLGKIQFTDMDIQDIMKTLSRWYDFDIEYQGKLTSTTFGGSFSRNKNLSVILNALQSTGDIHFKIEGRRVIVMP